VNPQAERRVGTVIGAKWRVDALLGSGSMAAVYAVTHRNGARAALKILHPTLCTDPAVCERFLGEGYLTNSVKHPGIVRVLDDGVTDDGCVFLVMDLLEGDTLEEVRNKRGGKLSLVEALDLADKLMDVLAAVHAAGIIHRDLKPQNVFMCNDGAVKLLDFGVARVFDRTSQSKLSMFGLVLGTPSFMSPEQALGSRDKVDHRSDIWSLGATLFTALTGETVHLGANIQAKLLAAATVKARSIAMVMPDLPPAIASAIDMALRFKKEDRWQSVEAFQRAMRDARQALGLGRAPAPAPAFDMALDEPTHADQAPPPRPAFDGTKTARMSSGPPGRGSAGPHGTFIGMGSGSDEITAILGNDGSLPPARPAEHAAAAVPQPARPRTKSIPPPLPARASGRPPMGSVPPRHTPGASFPPGAPAGRASRPDGQDGSIPAYGSTLQLNADSTGDIDRVALGLGLGPRRRSGAGVWLVAAVLTAAAVGGVAFFAVKPSAADAEATTTAGAVPEELDEPAPAPTAGEPARTNVSPAPSMIAIEDPEDDTAPQTGSSAPRSRTSTPRPAAASRGHAPSKPSQSTSTTTSGETPFPTATATQEPALPATTSEPKPLPPGLAPDPFGTPE
jgi:eukaryotic-like serine/threonine-protein kinase